MKNFVALGILLSLVSTSSVYAVTEGAKVVTFEQANTVMDHARLLQTPASTIRNLYLWNDSEDQYDCNKTDSALFDLSLLIQMRAEDLIYGLAGLERANRHHSSDDVSSWENYCNALADLIAQYSVLAQRTIDPFVNKCGKFVRTNNLEMFQKAAHDYVRSAEEISKVLGNVSVREN